MSESLFRLGIFVLLVVFVVGVLALGTGHLLVAWSASENGRYQQLNLQSEFVVTPDGKGSAYQTQGRFDTRTGERKHLRDNAGCNQNWPEHLRLWLK